MTKNGWWSLKITGVYGLNDCDREHIAKLITEGYTSGEVVQDEIYYQPEEIKDKDKLFSFEVYSSKEKCQKDFPDRKIAEYRNDDIEDHHYVDREDGE